METLIRVRKGDTCVITTNNTMYYAIALEDLIARKNTDNDSFYPSIFRFITVESISGRWAWVNSSFIRRTSYDKIHSDHITGNYVSDRVMPYPINLLPKETQKQIEKFKTKFNL